MSLVYNSNRFQNAVSHSFPFGEVMRGFPFNAFNCMKAYSFNGERYGYYGYDASGERTYKYDMYSAGSWTNQTGGMNVSLQIDKMMLYPNGYLNMNQNGEYTKHYYADAARIASKIGTGFADSISGGVIDNAYKITIMQNELSEVANDLIDTTHCTFTQIRYLVGENPTAYENGLYFYHGNHLSSTQLITDINANLKQAVLYSPWGSVISEYRSDWMLDTIPRYLFQGKERDQESNLDYFEARYYSSDAGTFRSRDPKFEEYFWLSPYCAFGNNPVIYIDPNGEDPIYARNFWGNVKKIGDDGKCGTGSYLVQGSVKKDVKAATKTGNFYTGSLKQSVNVMHIPTGQIQQDVQQTATATTTSGTSPETRVENGGHSLYGDVTARIWDAGTPMQTGTDAAGNTTNTWSITPFKIGGKNNQVGGLASSIQFIWHIHPNGSNPSDADFNAMSNWRSSGFTGNTFLIDVNNNTVTFFNENGSLMKVNYDDFKRMGNQEDIK
ncbi:MAG: RHS repeat-associated core domain-containing protein [Patescibacteria group bacterium]|nr:RHS repeat-associated core domain-containing protein [Patescibacteria group bacterium]